MAEKYPDFVKSTGYGTGDGLCGWNCYHSFDPFFPGISTPNYTEEELEELNRQENTPVEYNGKTYTKYEATQKQRSLERTLYAKNQTVNLLREGGAGEEAIQNAEVQYRKASHEYAKFSKAMNLPQQRQRIQLKNINPKKKNGLTSNLNNVKIKIASNAHSRNIKLEKTIQRCIMQDKPVFADDLAKFFPRIKPEKDRYIMSLHGTPNEAFIYNLKIDARTLANIIKSRKDYKNEEIILISCNTGNTEHTKNCFAQKFANEMGVTVYAPTKYGVINIFGKYYSGTIKGKPDGKFEAFKPQKKV